MEVEQVSSEEKSNWIYAVIIPLAYVIYLVVVLGRAKGASLTEVAYVAPLIWTIVGGIVATIVCHIIVAIIWPKDADKKDERDRQIYRLGEYRGQWLAVAGAVAALILAMVEADYFWIANVIYLGFVGSSILASVTKIVAYHRGFQSW